MKRRLISNRGRVTLKNYFAVAWSYWYISLHYRALYVDMFLNKTTRNHYFYVWLAIEKLYSYMFMLKVVRTPRALKQISFLFHSFHRTLEILPLNGKACKVQQHTDSSFSVFLNLHLFAMIDLDYSSEKSNMRETLVPFFSAHYFSKGARLKLSTNSILSTTCSG